MNDESTGTPWFALFLVAAASLLPLNGQQAAISGTPAFREFIVRVDQYVKMQRALIEPRVTNKREEIVARQLALRAKIRAARANAKPGDIFVPEAATEFRRQIRNAFAGAKSTNVRKTVRQGEPLPGWRQTVNGDYPEALPQTTVPPTLLRNLPPLPEGVAYGLVGHDFVLQDAEARLVIDFIPGVIP